MSDFLKQAPLGQSTDYVDQYDPSLLFPVPRRLARETLSQPGYPFRGGDWWTAYELSWLLPSGLPQVAVADIWVPANSEHLVESKSLKLYLNGFAATVFANAAEVQARIRQDLSALLDASVEVTVFTDRLQHPIVEPEGQLIDHLPFDAAQLENAHLRVSAESLQDEQVLVSHLLRSRCPVTGQPDWASVIVRNRGRAIEPESLLQVIVALRNHQGFHEQIIEHIFLQILEAAHPEYLSVYGRFTRRGGIDINPYRSTHDERPSNTRLVRQ